MDREQSVQRFLDLSKKSRRGSFKTYINMVVDIGRPYRMLSDVHQLLESGVDVRIGYIETYGGVETEALVEGLSIAPRRKIFCKGKEIEGMNLQSILSIHPEVVIVDELIHTNVEGSRNEECWQDTANILDADISVITTINTQHIKGFGEMVQDVVGIEVRGRVPDIILKQTDGAISIDLTTDELLAQLETGKIYKPDKIQTALNNLFKIKHILRLRESALKKVILRVGEGVESTTPEDLDVHHERFIACISNNKEIPRKTIRKAAQLAIRYDSKFLILYVQTPGESFDRIPLASQRHLSNHFELVAEFGEEITQVQSPRITDAIIQVCEEGQTSTLYIRRPALEYLSTILMMVRYRDMLEELAQLGTGLIILA